MAPTRHHGAIERSAGKPDGGRYDVVIVGASLSGCAAAIGLGRIGARVALLDKRPDPLAFKRICSHMIQASAVPTLERLGLLEPMMSAGAVRTRLRTWTPWGWIVPPPERAGYGVNLRRERLDPLVRELAATTPGVDLRLGQTVEHLLPGSGAWRGVVAEDRDGGRMTLRARLVVGADGRDSRVAELTGPVIGKLEMPNRVRGPIAPGLALIGDAALATDPLFGVGCGWAFQSAEWLADSVGPALRGAEPLERGLKRYRRRHRRGLRLHAAQIHEYATGRRFLLPDRFVLSAAARDPETAARFDAFATRQVTPPRALAAVLPRALAFNARRVLPSHRRTSPDR